MNEFDRRQLLLIKKMILLFKSRKICLRNLISKIEALIDELEYLELQWTENLRSNWASLELTYAYMLHTGRELLNEEDEKEIEETVNTIQKLIEEKIADEDKKLLRSLETPNFQIKLKAEGLENNWLLCPVCIDAWQSEFKAGMVMCPNCKSIMHNPNSGSI